MPEQYHRYRTTADFKHFVSLDLHTLPPLTGPQFKQGMQRRRQQYSKRLRTDGTEKIFGYERAAKMRTADQRRIHFATEMGFKSATNGAGKRYSPTHVPLLHSSKSEKYKFQDAFTRRRLKTVRKQLKGCDVVFKSSRFSFPCFAAPLRPEHSTRAKVATDWAAARFKASTVSSIRRRI